jgi:hypothetical protein
VKVQTQTQPQQTNEGYSVANEEIGEALLLRCWNKAVEQVEEAAKINRESGVKYPDSYINFFGQARPMDVTQKMRFLDSCRHKKSMEFITLDSLQAAGQISDTEVKLFKGQQFPRRELIGMIRHQDYDKNESLVRIEKWVGLTASAGTISLNVSNLDFTRRIQFTPDMVPIDPTIRDGPSARVVKIGSCLPGYETAEKIYLTPFNSSNVLAAMQKAQRSTETRGQISLLLSKDGSSNPTTAPDLDSFVNAEFETLWVQRTTPQPTINISSKDLSNYVKLDRESKEHSHQYT